MGSRHPGFARCDANAPQVTKERRAKGKEQTILKVRKLNPDAALPKYAHPGDAGLD